MEGLLFYDPSTGTGAFYSTDGRGGISFPTEHTKWRNTWTQIIPGQFGGNGFTDLLFYDPGARTGAFYTTDERGQISLLNQHTDWRRTWTQIIPGQFGGSGFTDLLFYDAGARTGEFYTTDGRGRLSLLSQHTDWRRTWTQIIPGQFGGSGFTDLLFYDADARTGEFYTTDGRGGLIRLSQHTNWRRTWTQIVFGRFQSEDIGGNFTFDTNISAENRTRLLERHRFAFSRIQDCNNLTVNEKNALDRTYRKSINHGINTNPNANASAVINGSEILINFDVLFPQGDNEIAQTLIHEMMHCAGFRHPDRRDAPDPNPDVPGDNGPYYGTPPLKAELCIAGLQSIVEQHSNTVCVPGPDGVFVLNHRP